MDPNVARAELEIRLELLERKAPGLSRRILSALLVDGVVRLSVTPDEVAAMVAADIWCHHTNDRNIYWVIKGGSAGEDEVAERLDKWFAEGAL